MSLGCRPIICPETIAGPATFSTPEQPNVWVESLDILLCCVLAQFLEVALGDESFHVSLSNVELAVLCQSDGTAQGGQQPISA